MSEFPTTKINLLLKIRDTNDQQAWNDFVALYRPAIYRFAKRRGLQEADAQDLTQVVLTAVANKISDWEPNADRARFRTWLSRVAQNQTISAYRRRRAEQGKGGSSGFEELVAQADQADDSQEILTQYRREAFRYAARIVRQEVEETSWQAFWLTAVEEVSVSSAAESLGMSVGAVYTARSRVLRRLQKAVAKMEQEDDSLSLRISKQTNQLQDPIDEYSL